MAEQTPYFDLITSARSMEQFRFDEAASLEGRQLISLEAQEKSAPEDGIFVYVNDHFDNFLRYIRALSPRDQEFLLTYYCLYKTQTQLSRIFRMTQTVCSFQLRASVRCLAALIMWSGIPPTAEIMTPILEKVGHTKLHQYKLADVIEDYQRCRSFFEIAKRLNVHRPDVRRTIRHAVNDMTADAGLPSDVQALGWWLFKLIDKASPLGHGLAGRARAKESDMFVTLPDLLGKDDVKVSDPDFDQFFQSRANL